MAGVVTPPHEYVKRVAGHLVQKMLKPLEELDRPGKVQPGSPAERVRQTLIAGYELLCCLLGSIAPDPDGLFKKGMPDSSRENIDEAYGYIVQFRDPHRWCMIGKAKYHVCTPHQRWFRRLARQPRQPPGSAESEALAPPFSGLADEDEERVGDAASSSGEHRGLAPEADAVPRPPVEWLSRTGRRIWSERGTDSADEGGSPLEAEGAAD